MSTMFICMVICCATGNVGWAVIFGVIFAIITAIECTD